MKEEIFSRKDKARSAPFRRMVKLKHWSQIAAVDEYPRFQVDFTSKMMIHSRAHRAICSAVLPCNGVGNRLVPVQHHQGGHLSGERYGFDAGLLSQSRLDLGRGQPQSLQPMLTILFRLALRSRDCGVRLACAREHPSVVGEGDKFEG